MQTNLIICSAMLDWPVSRLGSTSPEYMTNCACSNYRRQNYHKAYCISKRPCHLAAIFLFLGLPTEDNLHLKSSASHVRAYMIKFTYIKKLGLRKHSYLIF